ncbi:conserved hypothetical protein [Gammaproteobacteria bacterium]
MSKYLQNIIFFIIVFFIVPVSLATTSFEYGMNAFQQENYVTAFRLWSPLADQGDSLAQYNLGVMYYEGYGIPQNYSKAIEWFFKAAKQNNDEAQRNLGVMYYEGHGVPQSDVRAYMWFDLAASHGNGQGFLNRQMVAARMTPNQISEAQNLTRLWESNQNKRKR